MATDEGARSPEADAGVTPLPPTVIVGLDGEGQEDGVEERAATMAAAMGAPVRGVHVAPYGWPAPRDLFRHLEDACRRERVPFETRIVESGIPALELVLQARPEDILVLGSRRLGTSETASSIARAVHALAACPVILIRRQP